MNEMRFPIDWFYRYRHGLLCLVLIFIILFTYRSTIHCGFIQYDDPYYVTHNPVVIKGLTFDGFSWAFYTFHRSNWHPLTWLSHMLDCELYGLHPSGHHLTNLLLHIANVLFFFLLLRETTDDNWRSFLTAILFAVHPLHVESVVWVSERKDVLSAFFWLLTLIVYSRYVKKNNPYLYVGCLVLFGLGLMAKPMVITLPLVLFLLDVWPLNRYENNSKDRQSAKHAHSLKRIITEKIPFLVLSTVSSLVTYIAQHQGGALGSLDAISFRSRCINAVISYMDYLYQTVWPRHLAIFYPHPGNLLTWSDGIFGLGVLLAISLLAIFLIRSNPYVFVGWFWFVGTLAPVIGLVQVGMQARADRYTYIPHMGLFICIVWGISALFRFCHVNRKLGIGFWSMVFLFLMSVTIVQVQYWKNTTALFNHALAENPDNYFAHFIMAREEGRRENMDNAFYHYNKAVETNPGFVAMMHNREGYHLYIQGKDSLAKIQFEGAFNIRPDYANAHNNLGAVLAKMGNLDQAIIHFKKALELAPDYQQAKKNLVNAIQQKEMLSTKKGDHQME